MSAYSATQMARKHGYRSGLEDKVAEYLTFHNSRNKLRKGAKSSYAEWCIKHGFRYFDRIIPEDWLKEKGSNKYPKFIKYKNKKIRR